METSIVTRNVLSGLIVCKTSFSILLTKSEVSPTYDGSCYAAGLRKMSRNSELLAVQELMALQIGWSGGK